MVEKSQSTVTSGSKAPGHPTSGIQHQPAAIQQCRQQFLPKLGTPTPLGALVADVPGLHVGLRLRPALGSSTLAILRSNLGAEGERICNDLCPAYIGYKDTGTRLANLFQKPQSAIYRGPQFNCRNQNAAANFLQFDRVAKSHHGVGFLGRVSMK